MAKLVKVGGLECVRHGLKAYPQLLPHLSSARELRLNLEALESQAPESFSSLMVELLPAMAVWYPMSVYNRLPVLLPHVQRDNACRKLTCAAPDHIKRSKGKLGEARDQWSMPSERGYVRDDNSLVKNAPKTLRIEGANTWLNGHRMGTGFVACHIWPMQSATDPWLNSFVANLVWLPKPFDVLSDRDGAVRSVLQNMAHEAYRAASTTARATTDCLWERLARPALIATNRAQNFFVCSKAWLARREKKIRIMEELLSEVSQGIPTRKRSGHSHYDAHRSDLDGARIRPLADRLRTYVAELDSAR